MTGERMLGSKRREFHPLPGESCDASDHGLDDAVNTGAVIKKVLTNFRCAGTRDHLVGVETGHNGLHGGL